MQPTAIGIVKRLQESGHTAYFAGGCVRDLLLNHNPEDIDIATSATPDQIEELFEKTFSVGKHFGVILIHENGHNFEVATFRSDSGYSDGRRPDYVTFTDAREDALRRDFTINGLFYDPVSDQYYDYVSGTSDLRRGLLRFIGDAEQRICEDHLRILRAVRFKNRFDLAYHRKTREALKHHSSLIIGVAAERVAEELNKIIVQKNRVTAFQDLDRFGILEKIIPELSPLKKTPQPKNYHSEGDVFTHSLKTLGKVPPKSSLEVHWAALLHDVGKAETYKQVGNKIQFHRHQNKGEAIVQEICSRLKFSRSSRQSIQWLVHHHHLFDGWDRMSEVRKIHYFDHPDFADLLTLHHADLLGSVPQNYKNRRKAEDKFYEIKAEFLLSHKEKRLPSKIPEFLSGKEIMEITGLEPGAEIGAIKAEIRQLQLEKKLEDRAAAINFLLKRK